MYAQSTKLSLQTVDTAIPSQDTPATAIHCCCSRLLLAAIANSHCDKNNGIRSMRAQIYSSPYTGTTLQLRKDDEPFT
jgi:hypothetical protein